MRRRALLFASIGLGFASAIAAHDGATHDATGPGAAGARPTRAADGALLVDKALQRRLGLRTVAWPPAATSATRSLELVGEVVARPDATQTVIATEAGRLEAPDGGWPVAGHQVHRGELLAWLRPVLNQREVAERRAQIADLEQKLVISELTVERLRLQKAGAEDSAAQGNVYYEQSRAEHGAMVEQRRLLLDSLEGRQPLRAPADGRLTVVRANLGEVVAAGASVFELAAPGALRVVVTSFDGHLADALRSARLVDGALALSYRGSEPLADTAGWRLLFDVPASAALQAGQLTSLRLAVADRGELPARACTLDVRGVARVWSHDQAERFVSLPVGDCQRPQLAALTAASRLVVDGAALLSAY